MSQATFNAIFISDLHLGFGVTNTKKLFQFLKEVKTKKLFLVGDIIHRQCQDGDSELAEFLDILESKECEVIYIIGNHELDKKNIPSQLSSVNFLNNYKYSGIKEQIFITHGHCYDTKDDLLKTLKYIDKRVKIKSKNAHLKRAIKKRLHKLLKAMAKIFLHSSFRRYMTHKAIKNRCSSIICGHFHKADFKRVNSINYYNCGDWVDNCTYVAEDLEGNLKLLKW